MLLARRTVINQSEFMRRMRACPLPYAKQSRDDKKALDGCECRAANASETHAIELPKGTKPQQHVIVHLETSLKREEGFDKTHFPDKIVLHGGACFDVVRDLNGILTPLTNGSIFIERLSKDKEQALFCLDILHSCALQIISRRNLRGEVHSKISFFRHFFSHLLLSYAVAIHWSNAMLTSLYTVCALTNLSVSEALRDRKCRLLYADMLHEILGVLDRVAKDKHWSLDQSAHCFLPIPSILALLPLPNVLFSGLVQLFDFGVTSGTLDDVPLLTADLADHLSTEITYEFDDVLELASRYNVQLTTLPQLQKLVVQAAKAKKGTPALSAAVLYATVQPSAASRQHSTWFVLKLLITIVLTAGLMYLLR
ncbi:hypothetical protein B5M09_001436 [Aphanomyces astaci]|uniref:Ketopantoate reductase C-terminal domain-containing protein n=1 Tax=Aphanomyces astaci TaxID=112090 RepID=A0A425CQ56_APHAT|nr:hypothetical protein B5M09_001436 [Aphanomyces astaci]